MATSRAATTRTKAGERRSGDARQARWLKRIGCAVTLGALLAGGLAAQARPQPDGPASAEDAQQPSPRGLANGRNADSAELQRELISLIRLNPKMESLVGRDASLLGDPEYVSRNNPRLAEFLQRHPEVARNPEFYLFAELQPEGYNGPRIWRISWPDDRRSDVWDNIWPFCVFLTIVASLLWIFRVVLENRRWGRLFRVQSEAHTKLLERFGSSEELLAYMRTEPGRRFLESAPLAIGMDSDMAVRSPAGRLMTSLQLGIVLALAGVGLIYIRNSVPEGTHPLLVFGVLALTVGIGFIVSAGASLALARHLGLLTDNRMAASTPDSANRF